MRRERSKLLKQKAFRRLAVEEADDRLVRPSGVDEDQHRRREHL
jgi:hypothetical protein